MMRWCAAILIVFTAVPAMAADTLPPVPPKAAWQDVVNMDYPDIAAARKAWVPLGESAPVSRVKWETRRAMRMPCNFAGTKFERASWDVAVPFDLSIAPGLQFQFYCANPAPVSYFGVYLRSGKGWYSATFAPEAAGAWSTIRVHKLDMRAEGTPEGWGKIDMLRISAWRGDNQDTDFCIANIGLIAAQSPIALILGEWAGRQLPAEARVIADTTRLTAACLENVGLDYSLISDGDLTAERLAGCKVALLPYSPKLPDNARDALIKFIDGGGKLVSFYRFPIALKDKLGMTPGQYLKEATPGQFSCIRRDGDALPELPEKTMQGSRNIETVAPVEGKSRVAAYWLDAKGGPTGQPAVLISDTGAHMTHVLMRDDLLNKQQLLLALVGKFAPECWTRSAEWHLQQAGVVGPYDSFEKAQTAIKEKAKRETATQALDQAVKRYEEANAQLKAGKPAEAIALASQMHAQLVDAYCAVQKNSSGEHRAFWCHDAFGVTGMSWDDVIKTLADNGFTAILPNMAWGGSAYYNSAVLPVAPAIAEKGDQIAACLAACKRYGVACHVWKVSWNMGGHAPAEFVEKMKKEGRTQVKLDGKVEPEWLCPSNPDNQKLEIDAMVEIATKYEVDGIHFDYIRYPDREACFCPGCKERFEKKIEKKVDKWPQAVRDDESLRAEWLDFRRAQITKVVKSVSDQLKKDKSKVKISAAVFPNLMQDRDHVGQDWKAWCEKGYLDFVCPMDYTDSAAQFENQVKQQVEWAGKVPCYPGIGLSLWTNADPVCRLIDQIEITRKYKTTGFTVFNLGAREVSETIPRCGLGITRKSTPAK